MVKPREAITDPKAALKDAKEGVNVAKERAKEAIALEKREKITDAKAEINQAKIDKLKKEFKESGLTPQEFLNKKQPIIEAMKKVKNVAKEVGSFGKAVGIGMMERVAEIRRITKSMATMSKSTKVNAAEELPGIANSRAKGDKGQRR
jgi:hypothetical protein